MRIRAHTSGRLQLLLPYLFLAVVLGGIVAGAMRHGRAGLPGTTVQRDPVCGMDVNGALVAEQAGERYFFCTAYCLELFEARPDDYTVATCLVCKADAEGTRASRGSPADLPSPDAQAAGTPAVGTPAVTSQAAGTPAGSPAGPFAATWQGTTYWLCSPEHRAAFQADPAGYFLHTMWGIPGWLYYSSIAILLVISFGIFEWRADRPRVRVRPRVDLLGVRWLRALVVHPRTRFVARGGMVGVFLLILAAGLFGHQLPAKNVAPILTWTLWWGGLVWLIAYLGKAWCYVCPWDAIADWAEGLRLWGTKREGMSLGLRWPRIARNIWPATILFVGLTWIELGFGVTLNPRATAWLGIGMLLLGFTSAFVFDRRSFCRYGCLVGRVSGLYALFSPVEVRPRDRDVCRSCSTQSCLHGNERGEPCPTFQYLGSMQQNTYCISCMECVKSCEQDNVALNLRPWGEDLVSDHHRVRADEAYLALLMLSLTAFHGLTMTGIWTEWVAWIQSRLGVGQTLAFTLGMTVATFSPLVVYAGLVAVSRWVALRTAPGGSTVGYRQYFLRYAYALLPIAFFYHLAHNSEHLLMEGQRVVALMSDPLGQGWNVLGTAGWQLPPLVDLPTLWLLQVFFVMVGHIYSLWVARRAAAAIFPTSGAVFRSQVPMLAAVVLFSLLSLWLLKQPMEMRTSAM